MFYSQALDRLVSPLKSPEFYQHLCLVEKFGLHRGQPYITIHLKNPFDSVVEPVPTHWLT